MAKPQLATTISIVTLLGCVRPQMIVQKHYPSTSPDSITVFIEEPKDAYETLAFISITVDEGQSFVDFALQHMKNSAASVGGDALLIQGQTSAPQGGFAVPVGNSAFIGIVNGQTISGKVIRFVKKAP